MRINFWYLFIGLAGAAFISRPRSGPGFSGPGFSVRAGFVRVANASLAEDWARKAGATMEYGGDLDDEAIAWARQLELRLFGAWGVFEAKSGEPAYRMLYEAVQAAVDHARVTRTGGYKVLERARLASDLAGVPAVGWESYIEWK